MEKSIEGYINNEQASTKMTSRTPSTTTEAENADSLEATEKDQVDEEVRFKFYRATSAEVN